MAWRRRAARSLLASRGERLDDAELLADLASVTLADYDDDVDDELDDAAHPPPPLTVDEILGDLSAPLHPFE